MRTMSFLACIMVPASAQEARGPSEADVKKAELALAVNADDAAANLTLGKYLAFTTGDWDKALPHLAKGADPVFKAAAQQDLGGAKNAPEKVALGDEWLTTIKKHPKYGRFIEGRAIFWYAKAWPDLAGIEKEKMRDRLRKTLLLPIPGPARKALPASWTANGKKIVLDATVAHSGQYSVRIPGDDQKDAFGQSGIGTGMIQVSAGAVVLSGYVASDGTGNAKDMLAIGMWNQAGQFIPGGHAGPFIPVDSPYWEKIEAKIDLPKGCVRVNLGVEIHSAKGTVWIDDLSLKQDGKELLKNGSFEEK